MTAAPGSDEHCGADHCVTCADDGVPMRVLSLDGTGGLAECADDAGRRATVETALVSGASVGDTVLVHAGVALVRLAPEEAAA